MESSVISSTHSSDNTSTRTSKADTSSKNEQLEYNRFGISVGVLAVVGCMGGIAASCAIGMGLVALGAVAFATGIGLAMILAVAPMRIVLGAGLVAVSIDVLVMLISLFM